MPQRLETLQRPQVETNHMSNEQLSRSYVIARTTLHNLDNPLYSGNHSRELLEGNIESLRGSIEGRGMEVPYVELRELSQMVVREAGSSRDITYIHPGEKQKTVQNK